MAVDDDLPGPHTTAVRCEVFPLVWLDGQATYLRHTAVGGSYPAWWLAPPPRTDPSVVVRHGLASALGGLYDPLTSVVHSTSWRFEPAHFALVLSYLAILESTKTPPAGFDAQPLAAVERLAGNGRRHAVEAADVLVHGLRHFALLRVTDPVVATAMPVEWDELLADRQPLPAGMLHHYSGITVGR